MVFVHAAKQGGDPGKEFSRLEGLDQVMPSADQPGASPRPNQGILVTPPYGKLFRPIQGRSYCIACS